MQAVDACCRELFCALLLALMSPTSEKTPQKNQRCASRVAVARETPLCAQQRLYNILSALWGREPLDASLLLGLSVAHGKLPVSHSTGQKRLFLSTPPPKQGNSLREAVGTTRYCHLSFAHAGQQQDLILFL